MLTTLAIMIMTADALITKTANNHMNGGDGGNGDGNEGKAKECKYGDVDNDHGEARSLRRTSQSRHRKVPLAREQKASDIDAPRCPLVINTSLME